MAVSHCMRMSACNCRMSLSPEKPQMLAVHSGACNILLVKQC